MPKIEMLHMDCMEYMAGLPDKAFDLAIVDPPYGIGESISTWSHTNTELRRFDWDAFPPTSEYFEELFRVSENQLIWGGNFFQLPPTRGYVIWDKPNKMQTLSDSEFCWSSFDRPAKTIRINRVSKNKIHITQKPVSLYKWLLTNYAKPGDRILDTHGGSCSICIACHDLGFDLTWMELDEDYYNAAVKRYQQHAAQLQIFTP